MAYTPWLPWDQPSAVALGFAATGKALLGHQFPTFPVAPTSGADYWTSSGWIYQQGQTGSELDTSGQPKHPRYGGFVRGRKPNQADRTSGYAIRYLKEEIKLAIESGYDGFVHNLVDATPGADFTNRWGYVKTAAEQLYASGELGGFRIAICPDGLTGGTPRYTPTDNPQDLANLVIAHASSPAAFMMPGNRPLFFSFSPETAPHNVNGGSPRTQAKAEAAAAWWANLFSLISAGGVDPYWAAIFQNVWTTEAPYFAALAEMFGRWGNSDYGSVTGNNNQNMTAGTYSMSQYGKPWCHFTRWQDHRPYDEIYWEAWGSSLLRGTWAAIISMNCMMAQAATWDDYSEGTQFYSSDTNHGFTPNDVQQYYNIRWKLGSYPTILRDGLMLFHRTQPRSGVTYTSTMQTDFIPTTPQSGSAGKDDVECLVYLKAPATIYVQSGAADPVPFAGVTGENSFKVPLNTGTCRAWAERSGVTVQSLISPHQVVTTKLVQDFGYRAVSALRLNPDTGGEEEMATPDTIADLKFWVKSEDLSAQANGSNVTAWNSVDTYGPDLTTVVGTAPTVDTSVSLNGSPGIRFASNRSIRNVTTADLAGFMNGASGGTCFAVVKLDTIVAQSLRAMVIATGVAGAGASRFALSVNNGQPVWAARRLDNVAAVSLTGASSIGTTAAHILSGTVDYNTTTMRLLVDGVVANSTTAALSAGATTTDSAGVAAGSHPGNNSEGFPGVVYELIAYSRALTSTEEAAVLQYLSNEYSIAVPSTGTVGGTFAGFTGTGAGSVTGATPVTGAVSKTFAPMTGTGTGVVSQTAPPSTVSGLAFWVKAQDLSTLANGANVAAWNSVGTFGPDLTQTDGTLPTIDTATGVNGIPGVRFTNTRQLYSSSPGSGFMNGVSGMTVFSVVKAENEAFPQSLRAMTVSTNVAGGTRVALGINNGIPEIIARREDGVAAVTVTGSTSIGTSAIHILSGTVDYNATTMKLMVDGMQVGTSTSALSAGTTATAAAAVGIGSHPGNPFEGFPGIVYEGLVFNRVLSAAEQKVVLDYLSQQYSVGVPSTGTIARNLPALTGTAAGTLTGVVTGTAAGTLAGLTSASAGGIGGPRLTGQTVRVYDEFERADTATGLGVSTSGHTWVNDMSYCRILSGAAAEAGSITGRVFHLLPYTPSTGDDVEVNALIKTGTTTNATDIGLIMSARTTTATNPGQIFLRMRKISGTNSLALLLRADLSGNDTVLVQDTAAALTDNTVYAVRITRVGDVIKAYIDGAERLTYTLSSGDKTTLTGDYVGWHQNLTNDDGSRLLDIYAIDANYVPPAATALDTLVIAHRSTTIARGRTTEEQASHTTVLLSDAPGLNGGEVDVQRPGDWATTHKSFLIHDTDFSPASPTGPAGTVSGASTATFEAHGLSELTEWLDSWIGKPVTELLVQLQFDVQAEMVDPINDCLAHPLRDVITVMTSANAGATPRMDRIRAAGWTGKLGCFGVSSAIYSSYTAAFVAYDVDLLFLPLGDSGYDSESTNIPDYQAAGYRVGASTISMAKVPGAVADNVDVILTDYAEQFDNYDYSFAPNPVQGRGDASAMAPLTGAGAGTISTAGSISKTFAPMTGTGSGASSLTASGAGTLATLGGAGSALVSTSGPVTGTLPTLTGGDDTPGSVRFAGAGTGTFAALTGTGAATVRLTGAQSGSMLKLAGGASGVVTSANVGQISVTLPALTGGDFAPGSVTALGGVNLGAFPKLTGAAAGGVKLTGAGGGSLQPLSGSVASTTSVLGAGASTSLSALVFGSLGSVSVFGVSDQQATLQPLSGSFLGLVQSTGQTLGPVLIAHLGTPASADDTLEESVPGLELLPADVNGPMVYARPTNDGYYYLCRDATLDRTSPTNTTGSSIDTSSAVFEFAGKTELREYLDACAEKDYRHVVVHLEMKTADDILGAVAVLGSHPMRDRIIVTTNAEDHLLSKVRTAGWRGHLGVQNLTQASWDNLTRTEFAENRSDTGSFMVGFLPPGNDGYSSNASVVAALHAAGHRAGVAVTSPLLDTVVEAAVNFVVTEYPAEFLASYAPPPNPPFSQGEEMAAISTQSIKATAGVEVAYSAASVGGDTVLPSPDTFIHVKNGGGAQVVVSVAVPGTTWNGQPTPDTAVVVPSGGERFIPITAEYADSANANRAVVTYSGVTGVTVAAIGA